MHVQWVMEREKSRSSQSLLTGYLSWWLLEECKIMRRGGHHSSTDDKMMVTQPPLHNRHWMLECGHENPLENKRKHTCELPTSTRIADLMARCRGKGFNKFQTCGCWHDMLMATSTDESPAPCVMPRVTKTRNPVFPSHCSCSYIHIQLLARPLKFSSCSCKDSANCIDVPYISPIYSLWSIADWFHNIYLQVFAYWCHSLLLLVRRCPLISCRNSC